MDCNESQRLLAAYALGALDEGETARVESHIRDCPACRAEYAAHRQTVARLPLIAALVDPPASLKTTLMDRIDNLGAEPAAPRPLTRPVRAPKPRWLTVLAAMKRRPLRSLALSTTAIVLALVAWTVFQTFRVNDLEAQNDQLATTVKSQWNAITLAVDPKVETVPVKASEVSPRTKGRLLLNTEQQQAALVVVDLTPPKRGQVYQVWLWDPVSGNLQAVGTFRTWAGYGMWAFQPPVRDDTELRLSVSSEPEGGSPAPTSPMVLTASLSPSHRDAPTLTP